MKKLFAPLLLVFICSLAGWSQTPTPSPTATPDDDDVVKISTTLIQLDVTVTDKSGKIVTDLKPEDFEIYENGELQPITNFSFISSILQNRTNATPDVKNAPQSPAVVLKPEKVRRTIALVVDDLTLSFQSTYQVREALKKFVNEQMQDGDLVAIIRTGAGAGALQQFTSDKRQLHAAIERVRWNAMGRGNVGAFAPVQPRSNPLPGGDLQSDSEQTTTDNPEKEYNNFRESVFARGTLGALNYIVRGMQELPGRKSVMLFSDGFKLFVRAPDGFVESSSILQALRHLTDLANRASVVIYTLDARGLQPLGLTAEDNTSAFETFEDFEEALANRRTEFIDTQEGLTYLARQTGGFPLINNNDLSGGVQKVLSDQSYYLVGYQPDADTFDAKTRRYNKLVVKVRRPGLSVRYRSGFFGITDETAAAVTAKQTPAVQMSDALLSPFAAGGINLRLNALFGNETKTGSFVRSFLHIDAKDLKFVEQADGIRAATFDVLAVSFGDNGVPVDQIGKSYTIKTKGETYDQILRDGFVYSFVFPIKNPGAYQMRVALRDQNTAKIGSANQFIDVPNLKKEHLTLSGIILENLTPAQWEKFSRAAETDANQSAERILTNPQSDTSLRRFKRGTILRYGYEIYNIRLDAAQKPQAVTQMKVFRDGKLVLEGKQKPLDLAGQSNMQKIASGGAISLGNALPPGDYVLQIIVTDNLAKGKHAAATQFVQFEIVQ